MALGQSASYSDFTYSTTQLPLEIVSCHQGEVSGALSVVQKSIRPLILMSFEMDVLDLWTIAGPNGDTKYVCIYNQRQVYCNDQRK